MANYDYKCKQCNQTITISRGVNDTKTDYKCETCNSDLIRVYSNIGVTFTGSGFYSTDK